MTLEASSEDRNTLKNIINKLLKFSLYNGNFNFGDITLISHRRMDIHDWSNKCSIKIIYNKNEIRVIYFRNHITATDEYRIVWWCGSYEIFAPVCDKHDLELIGDMMRKILECTEFIYESLPCDMNAKYHPKIYKIDNKSLRNT